MTDDLDPPVKLEVNTRHPWDYELINHRDGTRFRGTADGMWVYSKWPDDASDERAALLTLLIDSAVWSADNNRVEINLGQHARALQAARARPPVASTAAPTIAEGEPSPGYTDQD